MICNIEDFLLNLEIMRRALYGMASKAVELLILYNFYLGLHESMRELLALGERHHGF